MLKRQFTTAQYDQITTIKKKQQRKEKKKSFKSKYTVSEHNILDKDQLLQKQYVAKNTFIEQKEGESILEKLKMTNKPKIASPKPVSHKIIEIDEVK